MTCSALRGETPQSALWPLCLNSDRLPLWKEDEETSQIKLAAHLKTRVHHELRRSHLSLPDRSGVQEKAWRVSSISTPSRASGRSDSIRLYSEARFERPVSRTNSYALAELASEGIDSPVNFLYTEDRSGVKPSGPGVMLGAGRPAPRRCWRGRRLKFGRHLRNLSKYGNVLLLGNGTPQQHHHCRLRLRRIGVDAHPGRASHPC